MSKSESRLIQTVTGESRDCFHINHGEVPLAVLGQKVLVSRLPNPSILKIGLVARRIMAGIREAYPMGILSKKASHAAHQRRVYTDINP
jgi:hypothetical protein